MVTDMTDDAPNVVRVENGPGVEQRVYVNGALLRGARLLYTVSGGAVIHIPAAFSQIGTADSRPRLRRIQLGEGL